MDKCINCGFNDEDYGCTCNSYEKWYNCPAESEKEENQKELEEYAKWTAQEV